MPLLDHLLVAGFVVVWPIVGWWGYRRFLRKVAAGVPGIRAREYLLTILVQWAWSGSVLAWWIHEHRLLGDLGLCFGGTIRTVVGASLTMLVLGLLVSQWRRILKLDAARVAKLKASLGKELQLLPSDEREDRIFRVLAVTAGVCEEVLFRGYLIWYLGAATGRWPAMLVSAFGFGAAHLYQGRKGAIKTTVIGLVMGTLYLGTGSLFWPIVLHAAIDLQGGALGLVIRRSEAAGSRIATHQGGDS
jgi:membrane protease YdiL (CAAX protease family)